MNIPVAFCSDEYMLPSLAVTLRSMNETSKGSIYDVKIIVKEKGKAIMKLQREVSELSYINLEVIEVGSMVDGYHLFTGNRPDLPVEAYYRLLIPNLLSCDKAIYLDGDVVVCEDLEELFNIPLDDYMIGAVKDYTGIGMYCGRVDDGRDYYDNEIGFENYHEYFNSGVLLMNLKAIRNHFGKEGLLNIAAERDWRNHDQDVLNMAFAKSKFLLDAKWNCIIKEHYDEYLPEELKKEIDTARVHPAIVHFAGLHMKPWNQDTEEAYRYFWPVAAKSGYYRELFERINNTVMSEIEDIKNYCNENIENEVDTSIFDNTTRDRILYGLLGAVEHQTKMNAMLMMEINELRKEISGGAVKEDDVKSRLIELCGADQDKIKRCTRRQKLAFEVDLAGNCNLNCVACAHFSPLTKEEHANADELKKSFERLGELFDGEVSSIHLMGGEPLLHPEIEKIMTDARASFPVGTIQIVTNGIKLLEMPESFWKCCHDNEIEISITRYPIHLKEEEIRAAGLIFDVAISFFNNSGFMDVQFRKHLMTPKGDRDTEWNFVNCYLANECIQLKGTRLYPCSLAGRSYRLENAFPCGVLECDDDSIDIFKAKDKEEILEFLCKPIPFCRFCAVEEWNHSDVEWGISKKEKDEWLLEE